MKCSRLDRSCKKRHLDHNYFHRPDGLPKDDFNASARNKVTTVCSMVHEFYKVQRLQRDQHSQKPRALSPETENESMQYPPETPLSTLNAAEFTCVEEGSFSPRTPPSGTAIEEEEERLVETTSVEQWEEEETHPYLAERLSKGRYHRDFTDMLCYKHIFKDNFGMWPKEFTELLLLVQEDLKPKQPNPSENDVQPEEKLAAVLEFFCSGSPLKYTASLYRLDCRVFMSIVDEVCTAIEKHLFTLVMPELSVPFFYEVATGFETQFNLPNVLGVIGHRMVQINQDNRCSIMAVLDANCRFVYLNIDTNGYKNTADLFGGCELGEKFYCSRLKLPPACTVLGGDTLLPHYFIGDETFLLTKNLIAPIEADDAVLSDEERFFNSQISRARGVVEKAFNSLFANWNILETLRCDVTRSRKIIVGCCLLHNFLRLKEEDNERKTMEQSDSGDSSEAYAFSNHAEEDGEETQHLLVECLKNARALEEATCGEIVSKAGRSAKPIEAIASAAFEVQLSDYRNVLEEMLDMPSSPMELPHYQV